MSRLSHQRRLFRQMRAYPLRSRSAFAYLLRYGRIRLGGKLSGVYPMVRYVGGAVLACPPGASSVDMQARYGLGEPFEQLFCLHVLRTGDLFCDVGANAGVYTVLAAAVAGAQVVAFEPVPGTFNLLMQNIWANGVDDAVDARRCGIGREAAVLNMTSDRWSFNHVTEQAGEHTVAVPVLPLDAALDGRIPRVIKVDVEGYEGEVLAGAARTLSDPGCAAVILELVDAVKRYGGTRDRIVATMKDHGFEPFWYDPTTRTLARPGVRTAFRWNQIFIRDMAFVLDRLRSAPSFDVDGRPV